MMRSILMILAVLAVSSTAFANDIYIEQVGDTLDLDITQDELTTSLAIALRMLH